MNFLSALWTIILVPTLTWIGKQLHDWAKIKKIAKYTDMLYDAVEKVVKELSQTIVSNIKNTADWTPEKQTEIKQIAKTKIIAAITTDGYKLLKTVNTDFEDWIESLIEASLYDLKKTK